MRPNFTPLKKTLAFQLMPSKQRITDSLDSPPAPPCEGWEYIVFIPLYQKFERKNDSDIWSTQSA